MLHGAPRIAHCNLTPVAKLKNSSFLTLANSSSSCNKMLAHNKECAPANLLHKIVVGQRYACLTSLLVTRTIISHFGAKSCRHDGQPNAMYDYCFRFSAPDNASDAASAVASDMARTLHSSCSKNSHCCWCARHALNSRSRSSAF